MMVIAARGKEERSWIVPYRDVESERAVVRPLPGQVADVRCM
jgi:hypothetical protein